MPRNVEPERAQLELTPIAHLSLDLRERCHPRLEMLPREDTWRSIQFLLDTCERERVGRTTAATPAPVAEDSSALVWWWLWGW